MSRTVATLAEVNRARQFLRLIGAPIGNSLLILAVVAFIRESGGAKFDIQAAAKRLLAGAVYTPPPMPSWARENPAEWRDYLLTLQDQAKAFKLILSAARHALAADFLFALALSSWDANHFGGWAAGTINTSNNRLLQTYSHFTGLTMPTPTQATAKVTPIPPPPTVLRPPNLASNYPDPYAARAFYDARHDRRTRLQTLDTVGLGE